MKLLYSASRSVNLYTHVRKWFDISFKSWLYAYLIVIIIYLTEIWEYMHQNTYSKMFIASQRQKVEKWLLGGEGWEWAFLM